MKVLISFILLVTILLPAQQTNGYKILGIFPTMARSHWIVGSALMKGLAESGHEVTVLTPFTVSPPIKNLKIVEVTGVVEALKDTINNVLDMEKMSVPQIIKTVYKMGIDISNHTLRHPTITEFLKTDQKFDVVVMEVFMTEAMLGFGHHFKAPVIGVSTFGATKWTNDLVGTPAPLSYVPHPFLSFKSTMTFVERLGNTMMAFFENMYLMFFYNHHQEKMYEETFKNPKPTLEELKKDVAFVLLNTHVTLGYPRPYSPNMVEVGGMHVKRTAKPLPENLKNFMDSAKDGVVYFSLGSNIKCTDLPVEKRDALLKTFGKLKQKVMWKWEDENLPGKPDNVLISKWFPQDDILGHPNLRLFITHGGLLSTTEATYHGVPIIGIPIFGDQKLNMARTFEAGYGLIVGYQNVTEESLTWALTEMLGNKKYAENAKITSLRYRDQPMTPLQTAVYWVEYVCRHKGAPHLHSAGQELNWFQYHNLDVFSLIAFTVVFLLCLLRRGLCALIPKRQKSVSPPNERKKKN